MTTAAPSPMLKAALAYGRAGLKVFPILELTKDEPLVKWGVRATNNAETDNGLVVALAERQYRMRDRAIRTWWSLDTDNKPTGNGEATLRGSHRLRRRRMARTPSGGIHDTTGASFANPARAARLDPLSIRAASAAMYCCRRRARRRAAMSGLIGADLADIDAWVIEACAASKVEAAPQEPAIDWDMPANVEWARHWLANDAPVSIEGQGGDDTPRQARGAGSERSWDQRGNGWRVAS